MPPDYAKICHQLVCQSLAKSHIVYAGAKYWKDDLKWIKIKGAGGPRPLTTEALIQERPSPCCHHSCGLGASQPLHFFKLDGGWTAKSKGIRTEYAKGRAQCHAIDPKVSDLGEDHQATIALLTKAIQAELPETMVLDCSGGVVDCKSVE